MDIDIKVNGRAMEQLLKSGEMQAELRSHAERIASAAGPGHRVESEVGHSRARAAVITDTFGAMHREATQRTLTRAVGVGG